jgi:predicted Zn-dependent protease
MTESPVKRPQSRPSLSRVSITLTASAICVLAVGCGVFNNDWKTHRLGAEASYDSKLNPGGAVSELLTSQIFKSLMVVIQPLAGQDPTQESKNHLQRFLEARLNKPKGVTIVMAPEIPASAGRSAYTVTDIRALEDHYRQNFSQVDQLVVYVLFVDGRSADDAGDYKLLGQAYRSTSIVIYENTLRAEALKAVPAIRPDLIESTVIEHEFGHLMGLVNSGTTPTSNHEDLVGGHHAHCNNPRCLMYYSAETSAALNSVGTLNGGSPAELDEACQADLKAAGGK